MSTKSKSKKVWIIILSVIFLLFITLLILPFAFKGKIMEIGKRELNKQLNAEVNFEKLDISLIRNFPNASVKLKNIYVAGIDDFAGDTLLRSGYINLVVDLKSLFGDSGFDIKKVEIANTKILAHVLKDGRANWDIMKSDTAEVEKDTTESNLRLKFQGIRIKHADIIFLSDSGQVAAVVKNLNMALKGDFTADSTLLATRMQVDTINFWSGGAKLVNKVALQIDAEVNANMKENRYTLANNLIKINAIPLSINGWVQLEDSATVMDLTLDTKQVDFKSLLSLVPAIYSNSFASLKASGNVSFSAFLKGRLEGDTYPAFDINLAIADGSFQYPDLPKSVQNIQFAARVTNSGGSLDKTVVDIPKLSLAMGGNPLSASGRVVTPISDPDFNIKAQGKLDLGMIKEVYPLEEGMELNGVLTLDLTAAGKMSYVEQNAYDRFKFGGNVDASNVILKTGSIPQDITVSNAHLLFNDRYLNLSNLVAKIGKNDISANGKVENYLAYALKDQTLKGDFTVESNYLNVTDFMPADEGNKDDKDDQKVEEKDDTASQGSAIIIPKNLDITLVGNFKQLIYDKMDLKNANALMKVVGGNLDIQNMSVKAFGGDMILTGYYKSENPSTPRVDFNIDLKEISFSEIFSQVEMLKKIAPIFDKATGKFNTKLALNSALQDNMMPVLSSIVSNGSFNTKSVALKDVAAFTELASALKLNNLAQTALRDIALMFEINDGRLKTNPFEVKLGDYKMSLGGTTGLDQTIDYNGKFRMPDKLNLGKFQDIGFIIGGTFKKPTIKLDVMSTLNSLIEDEKGKALAKVDSAKNVALDKGREAREKALRDAQKRADAILEQARQQSDKLIAIAQSQSDSIVAKASNPLAKELAKKGAAELVKQAQKQADNLNKQAKEEADKLIKKAESSSEF